MTDSSEEPALRAQAVVGGDLANGGALGGRAGSAQFSVGGAEDRVGGPASANPYELLSASLAACTAMTIRFQARRRKYPLSHVEVAVSYLHDDGGSDAFERAIKLEGNLDDEQRAQLMQAAIMCHVGRTLGLGVNIRTRDGLTAGKSPGAPANYDDDLSELPIPNIDPD